MALVPYVAAGSRALQVFASCVSLSVGDGVVVLEEQMRNANQVLGAAREIQIKNEALVQSLPHLQSLVYDAEEVLDEIDYFRLQAELNKGSLDEIDHSMNDNEINGVDSTDDSCVFSSPVALADLTEQGSSNALVPTFGHAIVRAMPRAELDRDDIFHRIHEIVSSLGEFTDDVRRALKLEKLDGIALALQGKANSTRLTSSYLTETKIFGRDLERDKIIELLTGDPCRNQTLNVLPIVGNGGIGKTTVAQYVYRDSRVETYFDIKIWICVPLNFDVSRLTRQMLECVTGTDQGCSSDLNFLQEMLKEELKGRRVLLVLDNMWDIKENSEWSRLVAPLQSSQQRKGNMILVTTRNQSVANVIGTLDPIALDGLKKEDFWDCFRAYAFGGVKGHKKLHRIGMQIADRLKGYPLAAKSVGALLRKDISVEYWTRILESKEWVSNQDIEGIIPILKLSYDYLPFHLQRCFSYCSLFPKGYQIYTDDLVHLWISQGFLYPASDNRRRLEEVGSEYLDDLINLGFFEKADKDSIDVHCLMHDLMHDLAQSVSSNECFIMDGSQHQPVPSTIRHVSIIATSKYSNFEKDMVQLNRLQTKKLKSLMLFGTSGSTFLISFQHVSEAIRNLRTLRLSGIEDDGDILCDFGHCIHLRYLRATKQENDKHNPWLERYDRCFPKELCRLYRLQFLNVGVDCYLSNLTRSFSSLVNLRRFICHEENHSEIAEVGKLASLQELRQFKVGNKNGFQIGQLGNLSELDSLCISDLENLETKEEANNARLLDREHLRSLHLSWDASRAYASPDVEKEVLEGLQPHLMLNHLQITGYRGAAPPTWLENALSLIHLQSLYLEDCQSLRTLPPFAHLNCLRKLHLSRMCGTPEMSTHSLEELVIEKVEELESWVVGDEYSLLASELQVLEIKGCTKLRELPFSCHSTQIEQTPMFPLLHRLIIHDCPQLMPLPPLPLGPKVSRMTIVNSGSPLYESLSCYQFKSLSYFKTLILDGSSKVKTLNGVLALHNLRALLELSLKGCSNLTWFSLEEACWQLTSLKELSIEKCPNLLSMPAAQDEQDYGNSPPLPSLEKLTIESCCIIGNQLTRVLLRMPSLSYLELRDCSGISGDEYLLLIAPGSTTSLRELCIMNCPDLCCGSEEGLTGLTSLEKLRIGESPKLLSSAMPEAEGMEEEHQNSNKVCLLPSSLQRLVLDDLGRRLLSLSNLTSLKDLSITESSDLETLDLHSCMSLEELSIYSCGVLSSLQGLQSCIHLRSLNVYGSPGFWAAWSVTLQELEIVDHEFCPQLERIWTDDLSLLTSCTCKYLASLQRLGFTSYEDVGGDSLRTEEQNGAFLLLTSLQELDFNSYNELHSLPSAMHLLPSLKKLVIKSCEGIQSMEELVLPHSLEELHVDGCDSLQSLPAKLNYLPYLKKLEISYCPGILSLHEQGLPPSLEEMVIESCENIQSLPAELHLLSFLNKLEIKSCPGIKLLPESGLPPSLRELWVWGCSKELKKQCKDIRNIKRMLQICF